MDLHGFLHGVVLEHVKDRSKGLLFHNFGLLGHPDDGGFHEIRTEVGSSVSARDNFAAFFLYSLKRIEHLFNCYSRNQRAHQCPVLKRIAQADLLISLDQPLLQFLRLVLVHDDAPRAGAALTGCSNRAK